MEFQAEGFNTLPEAMQWAQSNSFDVLLSDYHLDNQLNAGDVLKALTELKGKSFKSFVLTNFIDPSKVAEVTKAGFDGVIEKPISLEKFKSKVGT
jgi:CheY-like chemotaxis protein